MAEAEDMQSAHVFCAHDVRENGSALSWQQTANWSPQKISEPCLSKNEKTRTSSNMSHHKYEDDDYMSQAVLAKW